MFRNREDPYAVGNSNNNLPISLKPKQGNKNTFTQRSASSASIHNQFHSIDLKASIGKTRQPEKSGHSTHVSMDYKDTKNLLGAARDNILRDSIQERSEMKITRDNTSATLNLLGKNTR